MNRTKYSTFAFRQKKPVRTMSESIKHECGIALIALRKPYQHYIDKYGPTYAINKLYLLMEKQHNRGQDGAGIAVLRKDMEPGKRFLSRYRSIDKQPINDIFNKVGDKFSEAEATCPEGLKDATWLKENVAFSGEVLLGHLRYGTHGKNSIETCHPMLRSNNWRSRNLVMAGNFNMTNVDELFEILIDLGQHPKEKADTVLVMEKIGHFLDEEVKRIYDFNKSDYPKRDITPIIEQNINLESVLKRSFQEFDGGYAMVGLTGAGGSFVVRDPAGIRPANFYVDDEFIVVASEKTAIKTSFNIDYNNIKEIKPGHALIIQKDGSYDQKEILTPLPRKSCSFERIYFSRGSDTRIYEERKTLGKLLVPQILQKINNELENTVFSYIPNTAETCWLGLMQGLEDALREYRKKEILNKELSEEELDKILKFKPRVEKLVIKDAKLRTFITDDANRNDLVSHVYDTTYGVIKENIDTIVVIDDSIVRGTTLEKSIITMLNRLNPKKIIIVSSAPQIRYPDCYGIDMSKMGQFVAFRAALELLAKTKQDHILQETYQACISAKKDGTLSEQNFVKAIYKPFTAEQISDKIAQMVTPKNSVAEVNVIYQTIENLHTACPHDTGDWYFTGDYPTPGGFKVVNQSFINFMEGKTDRAY